MEEREDQKDRLEFVRNQLNILTEDIKRKIKQVTEEVENKVGCIQRANVLDPNKEENIFYLQIHSLVAHLVFFE